MKKEQLEKLEEANIFKEEIPQLHEIYTISNEKVHSSGYKFISVYGVKYNEHNEVVWAKKIGDCSDVLHFHISTDIDTKAFITDYNYLFNVDYFEVNVARYFIGNSRFAFKIPHCISDCDICIVNREVE